MSPNERQTEEPAARKAPPGGTSASGAAQDIAQSLGAALTHHRAGQFAAAEAAYRRILSVAPNHPNTLNYLGILCHQTGRADAAAFFEKYGFDNQDDRGIWTAPGGAKVAWFMPLTR